MEKKDQVASPAIDCSCAPNPRTPTIEAIQRDVGLANQYRIELIKLLLTIAAALLAFTVAFRPSLTRIDIGWAMWAGWLGLAVSMIGGLFHMLGWDHYYKSYRDHDWGNKDDPAAGKASGRAARKRINAWRRLSMYAQFGGFVVGVAGVALFAAINIDNAQKPGQRSESSAPQQSIQTSSTPPENAPSPAASEAKK